MKLIRSLLLAGIATGMCSTALYAADYYVLAAKPGPVAGTPLAVIALQASTKADATRLQTNVNQRGNTAGKWVSVGQKTAVADAGTATISTLSGTGTAAASTAGSSPAVTTAAASTAGSSLAVTTSAVVAPVAAPAAGTTYNSFGALVQSGKLVGGDRVFLMDGYHGPMNIRDMTFASPVTIAAMPGKTAQVDSIEVFNSSNLVFQDLKVWPTNIASGNIALVRAFGGSSNLVFKNLDVRSASDAGNYLQWSLATWTANKRGGFLVDGANISIIGNRVTGTYQAIFSLGKNALVEKNIVDGFAGDGMRALGDFSTVRGNKVQNCHHIGGNHDDGFQSFSRSASGQSGGGTVYNLTIENNKFYEWNASVPNSIGCQLQGIGMFDGMYENVVIRNNVISVSAYHGLTVAGGRNVVISNNTVVHPKGLTGSSPWIRIAPHKNGTSPTDVTVANNTANAVKVYPNAARRIVVANNIVVVNATAEFTSLAKQDFTLLPTAKSANAGSAVYATPFDIAGVPRPKGTGPDAGAYESQ